MGGARAVHRRVQVPEWMGTRIRLGEDLGAWDRKKAGEGIRTPDIQLGKLTFYH